MQCENLFPQCKEVAMVTENFVCLGSCISYDGSVRRRWSQNHLAVCAILKEACETKRVSVDNILTCTAYGRATEVDCAGCFRNRITCCTTKYPFSNYFVTNALAPSESSNASGSSIAKQSKTTHIICPQRPCLATIHLLKRKGDQGHPCVIPLDVVKSGVDL
ncbi:hypothetical protein CSKR_112964 [Clonorchis sinensis]|uniref:Uncharacterized protein n=1 Tax=Clonorchis sinensis TaxID=79923 RepID=A0A419PEQ0_CLOSI|nr:hypothetical protein CSKR_112964 [Clonorchis sinensis]